MSLFASKIISSALLIPFNFIILFLISWFLLGSRFKKWGRALLLFCIVALTLASMPIVAKALVKSLYDEPVLSLSQARQAQAIIVLGGGVNHDQPEFGGSSAAASTLERIRYAAYLHWETGLPIQVSGGGWPGEEPVARVMQRELETLFFTPVKWVLPEPGTTAEEARYSRDSLTREGINTILLVTNIVHMKRAKITFERAGFNVIAAPTVRPDYPPNFLKYIPRADALRTSGSVLHEWIGMAWYWLKGV
ncbi:MAG: YdcF family protein [Advenella sp.]